MTALLISALTIASIAFGATLTYKFVGHILRWYHWVWVVSSVFTMIATATLLTLAVTGVVA